MKDYKKVLLAVVLDSVADQKPLQRARELVRESNAELYIVHAIEHMSSYGAAYGVAVGADIEEALVNSAKEAMKKISQDFGIPEDHEILEIGPAKSVILEHAERLGADLIVVGSHGRHGIRLLLGSTANAVLHGAQCDVLAVRLQEQ